MRNLFVLGREIVVFYNNVQKIEERAFAKRAARFRLQYIIRVYIEQQEQERYYDKCSRAHAAALYTRVVCVYSTQPQDCLLNSFIYLFSREPSKDQESPLMYMCVPLLAQKFAGVVLKKLAIYQARSAEAAVYSNDNNNNKGRPQSE